MAKNLDMGCGWGCEILLMIPLIYDRARQRSLELFYRLTVSKSVVVSQSNDDYNLFHCLYPHRSRDVEFTARLIRRDYPLQSSAGLRSFSVPKP